MDRSRSNKRNYYYDQNQYADYDSENYPRTKPRYSTSSHHHNYANNGRQNYHRSNGVGGGGGGGGVGGGGRSAGKVVDPSTSVNTNYRILCHDAKVGGVIGKSGSIIKAIRQHTGAWINVHEIASGDEERIIEISDTRRRDPDGRMPSFSPAQEALVLIHERILESEAIGGLANGRYNEDEVDYGGIRSGGSGNRVVTRLVVSRMHVGSLLGKGGSIIAQMRMETKTQIRILPRDHSPRCVTAGEEIVQIVGDETGVKKAINIISSRLKESQHRDRGPSQGRFHSGDREFEDEFISQNNSSSRRSSADEEGFNPRLLSSSPHNRNNYDSRPSSRAYDLDVPHGFDRSKSIEDLVFRILCPNDRVDSIVGESNGIIDLLQDEIGVDVRVSDPIQGSDEQIIMISSDEGPDDELFPAQEALLHIQTRIIDLIPDKENIVTTRLLVPASEIGCLNEGNASFSEMKKLTGADIQNLPREKIPSFVSIEYELLQIVGEIKEAREAVVEVTSRLRSYIYKDFFQSDTPPSAAVAPGPAGNLSVEVGPNTPKVAGEGYGKASSASLSENVHEIGVSNTDRPRSIEVDRKGITQLPSNRIQVPLVTRSTLEVVIPEYAVSRLLAQQQKKLGQISELSGANVTLVEDNPEATEKVIRMSGTPDQAERAQSLLQGFLLSIQEDGP
ncbi:hypothetical protein V2J09_016536 [Rumex salicifolius]